MESPGREYWLLSTYLREVRSCREQYSEWFGWSDAVTYYFRWRQLLNDDGHCLEHCIPWLTLPAIDALQKFLEPDMRVFEYGSGGSTLFFARRAGEVVSMEHDADWHENLQSRIEEEGIQNCTLHHIPPSLKSEMENPDPADPESYVSSSDQYAGMSFYDYATKIESYPDKYFDVVVVDGRARPSCFKHAIAKVKRTGLLVWDNTNRDRYQPAMELVPDRFKFIDYPGPTPFLPHFTKTSIWKGFDQ